MWRNVDERYLWGLLIVLFGVGLFISEFFEQSGWTTAVRFIILLLGLIIIFALRNLNNSGQTDAAIFQAGGTKPVSVIESLTPDEDVSFSGENRKFDFYQEIGQFFENLAKIIHASFVAHSSIVFLWNENSKSLYVEFCHSENDSIQTGDQVDVNGTLPGSVLVNKTAILEQNIPAGQQSTRYYRKPVDIRSFLGVPVSIRGEVKGVLAIDSLVANDFSDNDLELLQSYERMISQGIEMISEREKSRIIRQSVSAQETFMAELDEDFSNEGLFSALAKALKTVFDFDRFSIAMIDEKEADYAVIRRVVGQRDGMGEGFRFALEDGINGWVVRRNKPLLLGDLEKGDLFRPRYSKDDKSNFGLRSFLGVPLTFQKKVYGLVSLENKQPDYYTDWDQNILMIMAKNFGVAYHALNVAHAEADAKL